jgi:hypothetical protein
MDRQAILSKFISTQGYKKDSPDKNRPMNVIPSNQITMSDVEFPVIGVDNLGNKIVIQPGRDYTFPGDYVVETPMAQNGGSSQPSDYQQFLEYNKTAPSNRQISPNYKYGNPRDYDHYGMWEALGKPKDFTEAKQKNPDWLPNDEDGLYHGFSVNPNTGIYLKSHVAGEYEPNSTTWMEYMAEQLSNKDWGTKYNQTYYDPEIQRLRTRPKMENGGWLDSYQKGGVIDDPLKMPAFLQKWGYSPKKETTVDKNYFQNLKEFGIPDEPKVVRDNVVQVKPTPPHKETIPYDPLYKFNPKNWGVPDYTHFGSFDKAYIEARKAGEKEFMWNRNRFNTQNSGTSQQQWNMYKNTDALLNSDANENTKKAIITASVKGYDVDADYLDRRLRVNKLAGSPNYLNTAQSKIDKTKYALAIGDIQPKEQGTFLRNVETDDNFKNEVKIRSYYNPVTNTIKGKNYISEEAHGYRNEQSSEILSFLKSYIKYPYFSESGQLEGYNNPDHYEFDTHQIVEPVLQGYIDGNIEEEEIPKYINNIRKHAGDNEKMILNYPFGKNSDKKTITLLQNELVNNLGYTLPKSTKKDGSFDGVWGEETETALNDYRKKINSKYQNGGEANWLNKYK